MRFCNISIGLLIFTSLLAGCSAGHKGGVDSQDIAMPLIDENTKNAVDSLYGIMSQGERVAQLHGMNMNELFTDGKLDTLKCRRLIPDGVGHFSQFASQEDKTPDEVRDMVAEVQRWIIENTPHAIPALCHDEVLTGIATKGATVYPQQAGQACSFNTELAELKTRQTASALRKIGGMMALSPMVDVCRNPAFNRLEESYGEDGYLSAALGCAFVRGLQGDDLSKGVAACSKHFLGYGGGSDAEIKELYEDILMPHEAMIRTAGSKVVMTGYHQVHGIHAVASDELQNQILRDYLGFDGITVSDYGSIGHLEQYPTPLEKAVVSFNAGNDVEFQSGVNYPYLPEAIDKGLVAPARFEKAVKRVLALKARLGLLDRSNDLYASGHIKFDTPEERQTAYDIASQSIVLLQNDGVLPIEGGKKIFLTGPNANSMYAMLGDYTYNAMSYFWRHKEMDDKNPLIVNLKDGLSSRLPVDASLVYERGCEWTDTVELKIETGGDERAMAYQQWQLNRMIDPHEKVDRAKALRLAAESDVIIAAMGENTMLCGENRDRSHFRLPGSQEKFVEELIATGKPVVLVLFGGRQMVINKIASDCAAILQAWYPGEEGGNAVADILLGNISPSGKLSMGYPKEEIAENVCYNYSTEKDKRIAWPFGHGLTYSTFEYSDLKVSKSNPTSGGSIEVSFNISNTGPREATEVAQLYISPVDVASQKIRPIQLQGFQRVPLKPGESKTVKINLSPEQFGFYDNGQWNVEPGKFLVKIGASSQNILLQQDIDLTGNKVVKPLRNVYFSVNS